MKARSALLATAIAFVVAGHAQQSDVRGAAQQTHRLFTATVELSYGIFDPRGASPDVIAAGDLRVVDQGREVKVREVRPLRSKSHFVVVIDRSESVWSQINEIKSGIRAVVERMKADDDLSVVTFGGSASLNLERTNDRSKIHGFLAQLGAIRSQQSRLTNIVGALELALDHLKLTVDRSDKNILLISDGVQTDFKADAAPLLERPRREKVSIYSVYIGSGTDRGFPFLKEVSERSGGAVVPTSDSRSSLVIGALAAHFAKRFTLVYSPLLKEKEFGDRSVEITNMKHPKLVQTYTRSYTLERAQSAGVAVTDSETASEELEENIPQVYPRAGRRMAPIVSEMQPSFDLLKAQEREIEIIAETNHYRFYDLAQTGYHVIQSRGLPVFERTISYFNPRKPFCTIAQDSEQVVQDQSWDYGSGVDPRLPPRSRLGVEVLPVKTWSSTLHSNRGHDLYQMNVHTVPINLYTRYGAEARKRTVKGGEPNKLAWGVIYLQCHFPTSFKNLVSGETVLIPEDEVFFKPGQPFTLADLKRILADLVTFKVSIRGDVVGGARP